MYRFGRKMGVLPNIEFVVHKLRGGPGRRCAHVDRIRDVVPTSGATHPIARSTEPGVEWLWCYVDDVLVEPEIL
jgi:hypothetical protein